MQVIARWFIMLILLWASRGCYYWYQFQWVQVSRAVSTQTLLPRIIQVTLHWHKTDMSSTTCAYSLDRNTAYQYQQWEQALNQPEYLYTRQYQYHECQQYYQQQYYCNQSGFRLLPRLWCQWHCINSRWQLEKSAHEANISFTQGNPWSAPLAVKITVN